jgi:predicted RNase H-like HicB family nuclease
MGPTREYTVLIEQDEDGMFVADVPGLRGCHTQARSMDELMDRVREVIHLCEDDTDPEAPRLRFVGVQRLTV